MSDKKDLLNLLIEKRPQKSSDLAAKLGVTTRTIYRWVEKLASENVPISATTGRTGGITLDENYSGSSSVYAKLAGLKKVETEFVYADWLEVGFSDEEIKNGIKTKYDTCKEAIFTKHVLNFTYHLPQNKCIICSTEPVKFFFYENEWHILAWIRQVEKFKVFKLVNMTELQIGPEKHIRSADFSIQGLLKK